MRSRIFCTLFILITISFFCVLPCKGQTLYYDLTACGNMLKDRRSDMYDYIENHLLNEVDKDSIQNDFGLDILYHMDLGLLYSVKYNDEERALPYFEYSKEKLYTLKDDKNSIVPYKGCLSALESYYFNTRQFDKAKKICEEYLALSISDDINEDIVNTYSILAAVYEQEGDSVLANNAHNECQTGHVKLFVKSHPEQSAILNQFQMLLQARKSLELNNQTDSIGYVNVLIMLANILKKVCGNDFVEPFGLYLKAYKLIRSNNLLRYKTPLIESCYVNLQEAYIKYAQEPAKSLFIKQITPDLIFLYDGILDESDIYQSFAASYGANGYYQQALDYDKLALKCINEDGENMGRKEIRIFRSLINDYWGLKNDTANLSALTCIRELKALTLNNDDSLYSECLLNEGIALRYLYKEDEAVTHFKKCLSLFKNKYGDTSDLYIATLNQIALTVLPDTAKAIKYLIEAKKMINASNKVERSTIRGVCINLAKCYITVSKWRSALDELEIAEQEEIESFGKADLSTIQLKERCLYYLNQGN